MWKINRNELSRRRKLALSFQREEFRSKLNQDSLYYYEDPCKRSCDVPYTPKATAVLLYTNTSKFFIFLVGLSERDIWKFLQENYD